MVRCKGAIFFYKVVKDMPRNRRLPRVARPTSRTQERIYRATGLGRTMTQAARRAQTERSQARQLSQINEYNARQTNRNYEYRYVPGEMNRGRPVFSRETGEQVGAMVAK